MRVRAHVQRVTRHTALRQFTRRRYAYFGVYSSALSREERRLQTARHVMAHMLRYAHLCYMRYARRALRQALFNIHFDFQTPLLTPFYAPLLAPAMIFHCL